MSEYEKIEHIKRIIDSCENLKQLESCDSFVNKKFFNFKCPISMIYINVHLLKRQLEISFDVSQK